jgi:hypothetical protein
VKHGWDHNFPKKVRLANRSQGGSTLAAAFLPSPSVI